jgi:hypothetical protein
MINIRELLAQFPRDVTIGELLDQLDMEDEAVRRAGIHCTHANCGRLIMQTGPRRWVHVAPDGSISRSCKSAAFDSPKPGDDGHREWHDWPRAIERQTARPPRQRAS